MHAYLKQATVSQTRVVGPFIDDTDFVSLETGLTIADTNVKLSKNGGSSVDKNSGGGTHVANGMYALTFDATDTATVGELSGSILMSGALVVVFKFTVLEEAIYDALFGSGAAAFDANGRVDVAKIAGTTQTARDLGASVLLSSGTGTGQLSITSGVVNANATQISDSTDAAVRLALSAAQILPGTVDTTTVAATTVAFESDDITEATANHYNGRIIIFTSGALLGQATDITSYTNNGGNGVFTVTALTEAPADDVTFIVV
jgi:hypothetical protein